MHPIETQTQKAINFLSSHPDRPHNGESMAEIVDDMDPGQCTSAMARAKVIVDRNEPGRITKPVGGQYIWNTGVLPRAEASASEPDMAEPALRKPQSLRKLELAEVDAVLSTGEALWRDIETGGLYAVRAL